MLRDDPTTRDHKRAEAGEPDWSARAEDARGPTGERHGRHADHPDSEASRPGNEPPDDPRRPAEAREPRRDGGEERKPDVDGKESPGDEAEHAGKGNDDGPGGLRPFIGQHPIAFGVGAIVLLAVIVGAGFWYLNARHYETTDDAFIDGRTFSIAPKVGGYVAQVLVTDNQHLKAGDTVAIIDQRDYRVAVDQAEAQVAVAKANVLTYSAQIVSQQSQIQEARAQLEQSEAALKFAEQESARARDLAQRGAGTVQSEQRTSSDLIQAQSTVSRSKAALVAAERQIDVLNAQRAGAAASLQQAEAQLEQAKLNLAYTNVVADQDGRVARLTGGKGQLAQAGTAISMFVPDDLWVTANYKETQLTDMRPGQSVTMTIDAYPERELKGHVASVQPGSGTAFSLLPAQNATGNYVKVVQRVPVKLVFDDLPADVTIGPGMSVVPRVKVR